MTRTNETTTNHHNDDELATVWVGGPPKPQKVHQIPGARPDAAGFVGDYRPLAERQADLSAPGPTFFVQVIWNAGANFKDLHLRARNQAHAIKLAKAWAAKNLPSHVARWATYAS